MSHQRTEHAAHRHERLRGRHAHNFSGETIHELMAASHLFAPLPLLARQDGQSVFGTLRPQATLQGEVLRATSQAEGRLLALGLKLRDVPVKEVQTGALSGPGLDAWREAHETYMLATPWMTHATAKNISAMVSEIRTRCPGLPHKLEKQLGRHFALTQAREEIWRLLQADPDLSDVARAELAGRPAGDIHAADGRRLAGVEDEDYGLLAGPLSPAQTQSQWAQLTTYLQALSGGLADWMGQTTGDAGAVSAFDAAIRPERRAEITALRTGVQISGGHGLHLQMWPHLAPMVNLGLLPQIAPVPRIASARHELSTALNPRGPHDPDQPRPPMIKTHGAQHEYLRADQISPDSISAEPYLNLIQAVTGLTLTEQAEAGQAEAGQAEAGQARTRQTLGQMRAALRNQLEPCWSGSRPKRENNPSAPQQRRIRSVLAALSLPRPLIGEALELLRDLPGVMWAQCDLDPWRFSQAHLSSNRDLTAVPGAQEQARP